MIGLALGAFEWSATSAFVALRSVGRGARSSITVPAWLLADNAPWWLLTNYPAAHDVFTWLDGVLVSVGSLGTALVVGGWVSLWLAVAAKSLPGEWSRNAFALSYALIPACRSGTLRGLVEPDRHARAR